MRFGGATRHFETGEAHDGTSTTAGCRDFVQSDWKRRARVASGGTLPRLRTLLGGALAAAAAAGSATAQLEPGSVSKPPATSLCDDAPPPPAAALSPSRDLYCLFLAARPGLGHLSGHLELRTPHSPFGVAVTAAGNHVYEGVLTLDGLPKPRTLGDYDHIVAWLATPLFDTVISLGPMANGTRSIGRIGLNKFMILVTAEARPDASDWKGRLLLRASSPSSRMSPPDMQEFILGATGTGGGGGETAEMAMAGHRHGAMAGAARSPGWPHPTMPPGLTMFPALMALDPPTATPFLPGTGIDRVAHHHPLARPPPRQRLGRGARHHPGPGPAR